MGRSVRQVLGIAAAIAIPFAAPAITTALAGSMALKGTALATALGTKTGFTIGSAVVGAGLGAASSAALGGDPRSGAISGGIGGGIGGFTQFPAASPGAPSVAPTPAAEGAAAPSLVSSTTGAPIAPTPTGATTSTPLSLAGTPAGDPVAGLTFAGTPTTPFEPTAGTFTQGPVAGSSSPLTFTGPQTPLQASNVPMGGQPLAAQTPGLRPATMAASQQVPEQLSFGSGPNVSLGATPATESTSFMDALKGVPGAIRDKVTDPEKLAELTLRAGGMLAGSALAGEGLSAEERALLDTYTAELEQLRRTNQDLFNQQLMQAQAIFGEAEYFDPEFFGLQSARQAQIATGRAKREAGRGLRGDALDAERRRLAISGAQNVATSFGQGYESAVRNRLATLQSGRDAMPSPMGPPAGYGTAFNMFNQGAARQQEQQRNIGQFFGSTADTLFG